MPLYVGMGAQLILSGQDAAFPLAEAKARTMFLRKLTTG